MPRIVVLPFNNKLRYLKKIKNVEEFRGWIKGFGTTHSFSYSHGTAIVDDLVVLAWYDRKTRLLHCSAIAKVLKKSGTDDKDLPYRYNIGSIELYSTKPKKLLKIKNESGVFVDLIPNDYLESFKMYPNP